MPPKKKSSEQSAEFQNSSGETSFQNSMFFDDFLALNKITGNSVVAKYEPFKGVYTGSLSLDWAAGNGYGIPRGAITHVSGIPGSGKTSLATLTLVTSIAASYKCGVISSEGRWNPEYVMRSGGGKPGTDYMLLATNIQEDVLNTLVYMAEHDYDLAIVDSIASMSPRQEYEGSLEDSAYALQAKVFSQFFRMRYSTIAKSKMAVLFINQFRQGMDRFDPVVRPGGKAISFYTSVGIDLRKPPSDEFDYGSGPDSEKNKKEKINPLGFTIKGRTYKNSYAPPFRELEVAIRFTDGLSVDTAEEITNFGKQFGVLTGKDGGRPGHWYYLGRKIGENQDQAKASISEDDDLRIDLIRAIREQMMNS